MSIFTKLSKKFCNHKNKPSGNKLLGWFYATDNDSDRTRIIYAVYTCAYCKKTYIRKIRSDDRKCYFEERLRHKRVV